MGWKEAYQEKAGAQLLEWKAWVDRCKSSPSLLRGDVRLDQARAIQRMEDTCRIAQVHLEELRITREDRWEFAKQAVERDMIELKRLLDENGARAVGGQDLPANKRSHSQEIPRSRKG